MAKKAAKKAVKKAAKKAAAKKAAAPAAAMAEWTILIYMAGDNDLNEYGGSDVQEMKSIGSNDDIHLIVQRDTPQQNEAAFRYRLRNGTSLAEDVVKSLGVINTGDPEVLRDFLKWGIKNYPAKRLMVVLWNHGSGWDDTDIYAEARRRKLIPATMAANAADDAAVRRSGFTVRRGASAGRNRGSFFLSKEAFVVVGIGAKRRAIAFDDGAQDFLDSVEMKEVLNEVSDSIGRKFDVIGMDACLMSMVEVGLQVRDAASLFCGSQELEPADGWPYQKILAVLQRNPEMDGRALCKTIVTEFVKSYAPSQLVTQSAFELEKLKAVQTAADALGDFLARGYKRDDADLIAAVELISRRVQRYDTGSGGQAQYVDLKDFATRLAQRHPACEALAQAIHQAMENCVFSNAAPNSQAANSHSHGLSVYLPHGKVSPLYANLDFGKGGWARFLDARSR